VDHWSLTLDLKILLLTVLCVLRREGVSTGEEKDFPGPVPATAGAAATLGAPGAAPHEAAAAASAD
jgi:hypothetical protein